MMDATRPMALEDFAGHLGTAYTVAADDSQFELVLSAAAPLADSGREGGSFRLEFTGPTQPILPQGIYPFSNADAAYEIFVVPVASDQQGTQYEAVFY